MESPFRVSLFTKDFTPLGPVAPGTIQALTVTPRHNQQPTAALTVAPTAPRFSDLLTDGTRAVITFEGNHLLGGPVRSYQGKGPAARSSFTFQLVDDWWLFSRLLGWPDPGAAGATLNDKLAAQDVEYESRTGDAETVLKGVVSANAFRARPPVTVASSLGRGADIAVTNRFHPLTDRLMPLVDAAGIGTTVRQSGSGVVVDVYPTRTYPRVLSEASGVVQDWTVSSAGPKASRVIEGGKGEGTARVFRSVVDSTLETRYGYTVEAFKDATNADTTDELDGDGADFLTENGPTNGISVTLSQTSIFRYDPTGVKGVRVGDVVTLQLAPGITYTDVLRSCTLTWSSDSGLSVTPQVGDRSDDPTTALASVVAGIGRGLRSLARR